VCGVQAIGAKEIVGYAVGPSLIALGSSIGSGEWLSVFLVFFAFIWGGWAASAGDGLFTLFTGRVVETASDTATSRWLATLLLVLVFALAALSQVVTRGLELANWAIVGFVLFVLVILDIAIVPASIWWEGVRGFFTPARPPSEITATDLGGLAGFAALASGLNWYVMNHYRDKGYGMGSRVGYIAGLRGERREVLASGVTFPDDERNTALWKRWYRFLLLDMWGVFFVGAFFGMLLPTILMTRAVRLSGTVRRRRRYRCSWRPCCVTSMAVRCSSWRSS
jgi:hypothetical protein